MSQKLIQLHGEIRQIHITFQYPSIIADGKVERKSVKIAWKNTVNLLK